MTATELREKLNKAQEAVNKRIATIAKQEAKVAKLLKQIRAKGWDETQPHQRYGTEDHEECYWLICDYDNATEEVKSSRKKLAELEKTAANWAEKLANREALEGGVISQMPEIFNQLKTELTETWTAQDIAKAENMNADQRKLEWKEFSKKWSYSTRMELSKTADEFRIANARTAEHFILDLYNRVVEVTGEVTDWSNVRYVGKALNGLVVGVKGKALVETITAGGYNIQRLHYRVLVHPLMS